MSMAARWWSRAKPDEPPASSQPDAGQAALCGLCIHCCTIGKDKWGYCGARFFNGQELLSPYLGRFSSLAVDPIEKKPLYHWRPGSFIFSLGSLGCTMRCPFCQNHSIAQPPRQHLAGGLTGISPQSLVAKLRELRLDSVAYTYNEPALQAEYILEAAPLLREEGAATVLVTNGMYSETVLHALASVVDAANIDLKCFHPHTYAKLGGCLETAKKTISFFLATGVHVEVTTLVVPGISDSPDEFAEQVEWLASLSPDIPLHISRYRPAHKYTAPPTDVGLLRRFASLAKARLRHVHIGNAPMLREDRQ